MTITEAEINQALENWGNGLVAISNAYDADGIDAARPLAEEVIDAAYGYDLGPVLFKPTLASGDQTFRNEKKGALSYFVAHDEAYPRDGGFALLSWRDVKMEPAASFINGDVAMWQGWGIFTDKDGNVTKANKSFGYKKDADGVLRIVLHHSSLPYQP